MSTWGPDQEAALAYLNRRAASMTWEGDALCKEIGQRLFYPEEINPGGPGVARRVESPEEAVAACGRCPVMAECRAASFLQREKWGVWGGISERARQGMLRSEVAIRQALLDAIDGVPPKTRRKRKTQDAAGAELPRAA